MAVETELKLRIAPEHLAVLKRHPLLKELSATRAGTQKLYNAYYDTPGLELRKQAMALRLRRSGRKWLQTLKGGGEVKAGLHLRNEWETPVRGEKLELDALEACGAPGLPGELRKKLKPLFVTDFSRITRMLKYEGAEIELCIDSGEIRAGKASRPISELELELKSGDSSKLFKLALSLLDVVPLEVEHTSKAEYGYRLVARTPQKVTKATAPDLSQCPDISSALQAMIGSCLLHLQANVPGAVQKLDEEYLHQVRVALRRLRVLLAMAETCRADAELSALHEQVAGLCVEFGRLRELDVFVTQILAPVRKHMPRQTSLRKLLSASEKLRAKYHAEVEGRLQSQEYQRLLLRFGAWMHGNYWKKLERAANLSLRDFAVQVLDKRSRQVKRRGKNIAKADALQLHALRIACKKLRYGAEFFASLFNAARAKRYLSALTDVQDILGVLNDIAVTQRLLDEMDTKGLHESVILVRGWIRRNHVDKRGGLDQAWKAFAGRKAFWPTAMSGKG